MLNGIHGHQDIERVVYGKPAGPESSILKIRGTEIQQRITELAEEAVGYYAFPYERALGGKTTWENVVICCVPCNQKKGARLAAAVGMRLSSVPRRPKKLPDAWRMTFTFQKGMPHGWKNWLRDFSYWNGELENDNTE